MSGPKLGALSKNRWSGRRGGVYLSLNSPRLQWPTIQGKKPVIGMLQVVYQSPGGVHDCFTSRWHFAVFERTASIVSRLHNGQKRSILPEWDSKVRRKTNLKKKRDKTYRIYNVNQEEASMPPKWQFLKSCRETKAGKYLFVSATRKMHCSSSHDRGSRRGCWGGADKEVKKPKMRKIRFLFRCFATAKASKVLKQFDPTARNNAATAYRFFFSLLFPLTAAPGTQPSREKSVPLSLTQPIFFFSRVQGALASVDVTPKMAYLSPSPYFPKPST